MKPFTLSENNPLSDPNRAQYKTDMRHLPSINTHVSAASDKMIGEDRKARRHFHTQEKLIKHSSTTERTNTKVDNANVNKFSNLPKSHMNPQPNNFGQLQGHPLTHKAGATGLHKGGIKGRSK